MADTNIKVVQNDIAEAIEFVLLNADGTVPDLTGSPTVVIHVQNPTASALKFTASVSVINATTGLVRFVSQSGHFDIPGKYLAEVQVTDNGGQVFTFPGIVFTVLPELPLA